MKNIISVQSHVVYGHAGNSSAVFPMQRLGCEVWPIHTVQFSNHTQYPEGWSGSVFPPSDIDTLMDGLDAIGKLPECDAVLTGYLGSESQCDSIIAAVNRVRQTNPSVLYVCDPVMGDVDKGCILPAGVTQRLIDDIMPIADVIVPNQFELTQFTGVDIKTKEDAINACQKALELGPKVVFVKHLHVISKEHFTMILASGEGVFLVQRPYFGFERQPVGVGDLISGIFTALIVNGLSIREAFQHCNAACYGVLKQTYNDGSWELRTVSAQDEIVKPTQYFEMIKLA